MKLLSERSADRALLFMIACLLLVGGCLLIAAPAPRYSAAENRCLADAPVLSADALREGSYAAAWDRYTAERLPFRTLLRRLHGTAELSLGKREVNGVILTADGSLLRRHTVNEHLYRRNLRALASLEEKAQAASVSALIRIVPRRIDVCTALLPFGYDPAADAAPWQELAVTLPGARAAGEFTARDWFRTDHHWNTDGAYGAYLSLCEALGLAPYPPDAFTPQTVCNSFQGTADAAAGISGIAADTITLWRYEGDEALRMQINGKPAPFAGIYDFDRLQTRDKYALFLGGNHGLLEIDNGDNDTRPTILVLHDSFANALIPFLCRHYRVVAADPRYGQENAADLLSKVDVALVLCGMQTLSETPFYTAKA